LDWRQRVAIPATSAAVLMLVIAFWGWFRSPSSPGTPTKVTVPVPGGHQMFIGQNPRLAISPDGRTLVYYTDGLLHVRSLDNFDAVPLAGTERAESPFFSPDGAWIGFSDPRRRSGLNKIATDGGPVLSLVGVPSFLGADWSADGRVLHAPALGSSGIWLASEDGSEARRITTVLDSALETAHGWPQFLPDGKSIVFTVVGPSGGWEDGSVVVQDIASGERRAVIAGATYGRYVSTGHMIYAQADGTILAVPFDLNRLRVAGNPIPVASGVRVGYWGGAVSVAVSDGGTLAFVRGTSETRYFGGRVALDVRQPGHNDIWLVNTADGTRDHFTFETTEDESPVWSPDGLRIAYSSAWTAQSRRVLVKPVDGSTDSELIHLGTYHLHLTDWSPDGEWLAFYEFHPTTGLDVWLVSADGEGEMVPVDTATGSQRDAVFSPDGKWLAYESDQSGIPEIYVVSFPGLGAKTQISEDGGSHPRWGDRGEDLFYVADSNLVVVSMRTEGRALRSGPPRILFSASSEFPDFDVTSDGRHVATLDPNPEAPARELRVVLNWFETLRASEAQ
jgi:serine/threonine-protein kinase